ncbi:hypothetical protein Nepgr_001190 [Nepenthes gracilis]|uniref:Dof zinc finger protein n=1 Tax=Nepenthes gracilis TaxID=150966 RepID=A0AAD3P3Z4_NEPGR|nr:hypothetical protein Nepgr_001190 [Nepenthes gracilis]
MVFSSVPVYLDPPNWQQEANQQQSIPTDSPCVVSAPLTAAAGSRNSGGGTGGSTGMIRPVSMANRARLAMLPLPQPGLKCPRCESTNTKFCYFNNYSLSQPRHFCKTCRRYWTRGGALRNVPVGGGFRRNNKRSKGNRSKSPVPSERRGGIISTTTASCSSTGAATNFNVHLPSPLPPQLPFLLDNFGDLGLQLGGIHPHLGAGASSGGGAADAEFRIGVSSGISAGIGQQPYRLPAVQQFPFLASLEQPVPPLQPPANDLCPFPSNQSVEALDSVVKFEENEGLNLSKNLMGIHGSYPYNWSSNAWPDLL